MRWHRMAVAAALTLAACGGASESPAGTSPSPSESVPATDVTAEAVADRLISELGDEEVALAAVLLAGDGGYGVAQIVPAGTEGWLQPDGAILNADGAVATPDYEPSRLLVDDVTGEVSGAVGFRSPPERVRLTWVMEGMNEKAGSPRGSLVLLLMFLEAGYSLEQIVLAMLAGDAVAGRSADSGWYMTVPVRLVDETGELIKPERPSTRGLYELGDRLEPLSLATSTTVASTDGTAAGGTAPNGTAPNGTTPDGTAPDGTAPEMTQPSDPAGGDQISGGSFFQITADTPGLGMFGEGSGFCLDYSDPLDGGLWISLTACTDAPRFDIVHDLEAGTVAGSIDVELTCPGIERWCADRDQVRGTVSGSFGPIAYGEQPDEAPEGWPFPDDHWYSSGLGYWWAGAPIELDVSIAGDHYILESVYSADVTTTITGWVESSLAPASLKPGELPTEWGVSFRVIIEYVDTVEPRWDFYVGYDAIFEEGSIDIPSWKK